MVKNKGKRREEQNRIEREKEREREEKGETERGVNEGEISLQLVNICQVDVQFHETFGRCAEESGVLLTRRCKMLDERGHQYRSPARGILALVLRGRKGDLPSWFVVLLLDAMGSLYRSCDVTLLNDDHVSFIYFA